MSIAPGQVLWLAENQPQNDVAINSVFQTPFLTTEGSDSLSHLKRNR